MCVNEETDFVLCLGIDLCSLVIAQKEAQKFDVPIKFYPDVASEFNLGEDQFITQVHRRTEAAKIAERT